MTRTKDQAAAVLPTLLKALRLPSIMAATSAETPALM